jgi:hypothetical protein
VYQPHSLNQHLGFIPPMQVYPLAWTWEGRIHAQLVHVVLRRLDLEQKNKEEIDSK